MNPLFYISGVEEEAKKVNGNSQKLNILNLFTLFSITAFLAGFSCFYWFGKSYFNSITGIFLGCIYATLVLSMDRSLFKSGHWTVLVGRALAIILLSLFTGAVAGITTGKTVINTRIERDTGYQNEDYQNAMRTIDEKYKKQIEKINFNMLKEIRENPVNTNQLKSVFKEMKEDNEKERERSKDVERIKYKIEQPDYSIGNVVITYFNRLQNSEKFNGFYWLFFILEFMPLLWKGIYILNKR